MRKNTDCRQRVTADEERFLQFLSVILLLNHTNCIDKRTRRMLARDPLPVAMVTSELVADVRVNGTVVVDLTVQRVWHSTAL